MKNYLQHLNESNTFNYYIPDLTDKYYGQKALPPVLRELKAGW